MSNNNGRPKACANIYIHGRLKNKTEMGAERKRIMSLRFDDLLKECSPITQEKIDHIKELVDGIDIEIDIDQPLDQKDD